MRVGRCCTPRPVLITGCSSGIGLVAMTYLAERGILVYATVGSDDDRERVGTIPNVGAFVCDVTDDGQVAALRAAIDERRDGVWGFVHNAGIGYLGHLIATPLEDMKQVFVIDVFGVHRVTNAFIDLVSASRRRVVTISSLSGTLSSALMGAYSMSKRAGEAYTDTLAAQMEPRGVDVAAVAPGNYDSRMVTNVVERFDAPAGASPELLALYEDPGAQDGSAFPPPDDVAEACFAALFDEVPLARYLVVPVVDEADRTLAQAAAEWARLNVSTPYTWTLERLVEEVERASAG